MSLEKFTFYLPPNTAYALFRSHCFEDYKPVVHEAMGTAAKKYQTSVPVPPAPVWVPSQRPLAPRVASVTSVANYKGDNEMIRGLCTDLLTFVFLS